MPPRMALTVLLATAALLVIAAQASAHPRTGPARVAGVTDGFLDVETVSPAAPPAIDTAGSGHPAGWLVLSAPALAVVVAGRRLGGRHLLALAVLTTLAILEVEAGVHSVHHLGDLDDVDCAVAAATTHMDGVANAGLVPVALAASVSSLDHPGTVVALDRRGSRLDHPRAPPA